MKEDKITENLNISINLVADYENIILSECIPYFEKNFDATFPQEKWIIEYYNMIFKIPLPKKREIIRGGNFSCPVEYKAGLKIIEDKIINGDDLSPHLSTRVFKTAKRKNRLDGMLADFAIHHLHLGTEQEECSSFIKRTEKLLFCIIEDNVVYFLKIANHRESDGTDYWADQSMLEEIIKEYPHLFKRSILNDISLKNKITDL